VTSFESVADSVNTEEQKRSGATKEEETSLKEHSRPYNIVGPTLYQLELREESSLFSQ
jgi:hypothetical protein